MKLLCSLFFGFGLLLTEQPSDFSEQLKLALSIEDLTTRVYHLEKLKIEPTVADSISIATLHHSLAVDYRKLEKYTEAIENALIAVGIRESIQDLNVQDLDKSLYNLYSLYKKIDEPAKQIEVLHRLVNTGHNTIFSLDASIKLALHFTREGSYFEAIGYLDKVISGYVQHNNKKYLERAHRIKIAIFAEMGSQDTMLLKDVLYHADQVEKTIERYPQQRIGFYNNLGVIYRTLGKQSKALFYYQKALDSTGEEIPYENLPILHLNIGELYAQLNQPVKAKEFLNKVLESGDTINISAVYNNLGYYYANTLSEEIEYHQKAIKLIGVTGDLSDDSYFLARMRNFPYKQELLSYLIDLSQAWIKLYEHNNDKQCLQEALHIFYAIDNLISIMRLDSATKRSKLFWIKRGVNSYLGAVKVCFLLGNPNEAFYFMEKNKSLYLLEQLSKLQLRSQYKIPKDLVEREFELSYNLLSLKNRIRKAPESPSLHKEFNKVWHELTLLSDSLKRMFPDYNRSDPESKITSLEEFGDFLKQTNTTAIEYILGEKKGYGLWTDGYEIQFFQLNDYIGLVDNVGFLKQVFVMPLLTRKTVATYEKKALNAFKILFPWDGAIEQLTEKRIAVIPDGVLHNLPFEALLTSDTSVLKDNYFINIVEISYLNSASVVQNLYESVVPKEGTYLGIAPVSFKFGEMIELRNSEQSIKEIATLFPSVLKLKEEANKEDFLSSSGEYSVLHLNTHAGVDSVTKKPWLALHDTLVYLEDIFKMSQSNNLVILDACKTGNGKWQEGEGVESLSRAFFHTGTQSVIASHWNANEIATNKILLTFFKGLKDGRSKSNALRQAKLEYLKEHQLSSTFPYFWASLTLTGNPEALSDPTDIMDYWMFLLLVPIIGGLYIITKRGIL